MLKVASFSIQDDKGINELLSKYRLAPGAHILVSDGHVCIPYEDGEPIPQAQRIIALLEQKARFLAETDIITHSQNALEFLIADAKSRVNETEANLAEANAEKGSKEKAKKVSELETTLKQRKAKLAQLEMQKEDNKIELARYAINIEQFSELVRAIEEGRA